jgi:hypothetical protein
MTAKSKHVQIRVTPDQKATLERRARAAGLDVSSYMLGRALPPEEDRFVALLAALGTGDDHRFVLAELNDFLTTTPAGRLAEALSTAHLNGLSPWYRNYVAAMVEQAAYLRGFDPPAWTRLVPPLDQPWFATPLRSLRLHLLKASPVPFKRRNLFVDATVGDRV